MKLSPALVLGLLAFAYAAICWKILESRNRAVPGGVIQQFNAEYAAGGSRKWRFGPNAEQDPRKPLVRFIRGFGLAIYPACLISMIALAMNLTKGGLHWLLLFPILGSILILYRLMSLGVFSALGD